MILKADFILLLAFNGKAYAESLAPKIALGLIKLYSEFECLYEKQSKIGVISIK